MHFLEQKNNQKHSDETERDADSALCRFGHGGARDCYSVFRYSSTAFRSSGFKPSPKTCPALEWPGKVVS